MTLPHLISFSGRKGSGKTELANACSKYGYKIINFADNLKNLVTKCLNISRDELETWKDEELNWDLSDKIEYISKELSIDYKIVEEYFKRPFHSIRQILQIVGTDIIRKHNPDWHVNKTMIYIKMNETQKFCIGDCRFINEKTAIETLGGECWFIIRPEQTNVSNHISEIELNWSLFGDKVIVNSMERGNLLWKWDNYLYKRKMGLETDPFVNRNLINFSFLYPDERSVYLLGFFRGSDIFIKNNTFTIQNKRLLQVKSLKIELGKDYRNNAINSIDIYNPYIIENLKLWNIFDNKNKIPDQIKKDKSFIKYWIIGLIDGCGKVDKNTLIINNLSKEILECICENFCVSFQDVCKEQKDKLYTLFLEKERFIDFIKWLGISIQIGLIENWKLK